MLKYKPYSSEWHRCRYLAEALNKYIEDGENASVIVSDIVDILSDWVDEHEDKADKLRQVINNLS